MELAIWTQPSSFVEFVKPSNVSHLPQNITSFVLSANQLSDLSPKSKSLCFSGIHSFAS